MAFREPEPFAKPTLAIAQVCWISARSASEMASEVRSPRATRLTYEGSQPSF